MIRTPFYVNIIDNIYIKRCFLLSELLKRRLKIVFFIIDRILHGRAKNSIDYKFRM